MVEAAESWVSDNTSFLVGTVLGILGILTGAYFYIKGRRTKTLDWHVLSNDAVVIAAAARSVNLEMNWGGRRLMHPRLAMVRIQNTGTDAIAGQDIYEPVQVRVEGGELLSASLVNQPTGNFIDGPLDVANDSVSIKPKLLNSGEFFTLQLLMEAEYAKISVSSRIANLTRPMGDLGERLKRNDKNAQLIALAAQVGGLMGGLAVLEWFSFAYYEVIGKALIVLGFIGALVGYAIHLRGTYHRGSGPRRR